MDASRILKMFSSHYNSKLANPGYQISGFIVFVFYFIMYTIINYIHEYRRTRAHTHTGIKLKAVCSIELTASGLSLLTAYPTR